MTVIAPLALTMGEPAGIGPELAAKAWHRRAAEALPPFFFLGTRAAIETQPVELPWETIEEPAAAAAVFPHALPILEIAGAGPITPGRPHASGAPAVIAAIDRGAELAMTGQAAALVTNPIHKQTLYEAGFAAAGHTDYLARLAGVAPEDAVMMLAVPGLRVVPLTVHIPLAAVPGRVTEAALARTARIAATALATQFGIARPRLAVAGLNPHAGEGGALGAEEIEIIAPAIARLRADGLDVRGPAAADTLFHAEARRQYDVAICMYHDQALIPLKTLDFDRGVNVTLGLPFVRTSPDHGTALDIAGRGEARPDSVIAALRLAGELAERAHAVAHPAHG